MPSSQPDPSSIGPFTAPLGVFAPAMEYMVDAAQRSVLFWDVMRQRGNQYREHLAETAPNVLDYEVELLVDGRTLERPVNYGLVRVVPPPGIELDMTRRPFVIVDPRAGHGPGIGGFKADSEMGVAFKAGHPCYFVGFLPDPVPGPDHRGHRARRGDFSGEGHHAAPQGRRQTLRDRQLSGRLGGHDARRCSPRAVRADHHRRLPAIVLGWRARQKPDALQRRAPRRQLADRARERPRPRQVRRRLAGAEFREPEPR